MPRELVDPRPALAAAVAAQAAHLHARCDRSGRSPRGATVHAVPDAAHQRQGPQDAAGGRLQPDPGRVVARQWSANVFAAYVFAAADPRGTFVGTASSREEALALGEEQLQVWADRGVSALNHQAAGAAPMA